MRQFLILATLALGVPASAANAADPVPLKPGPGSEITATVCNSCHTSNYIVMNSTFMPPAGWKAEVAKMRNAFGAPLDEDTQAAITTYLSANYAVKP
jgi:sulfite dehydrogenase (cytochrome) subunit B